MKLDEAQTKKVEQWIAQGLKLSDIQKRLGTELGISMTYMDVRLLVDDLKLTPKDIEPAKPLAATLTGPGASAMAAASTSPAKSPSAAAPAGPPGVSLAVDQIARPGAVVSGKVTFTDGKRADWYIDQTGHLGLVPQQAGYRPPPADVQQFQTALESELSKLGF
jgi:hypothetical protein